MAPRATSGPRRARATAALALLAAICLTPTEASPQQRTCRKCDGHGALVCPVHKSSWPELEDNVLYCSVAEVCELGCVDGWLVCSLCEDEQAAERLAGRRVEIDHWAKILQPYHDQMGRRLRLAQSEHFLLVWEIEGMKVNKRYVEGHELMHLYVDRLERVYEDYVELMGADDAEFAKKASIFVWWHEGDQELASLRYCAQGSKRGMKLMGPDAAYSVCGNRQYYVGDEQLHRNIVHCAVHLLVSHQAPSQWLGNVKAGWVDEGLPHYFEHAYFGICDNYCYEETNTQVGFRGGKYKVSLRRLVAADKAPSVAEVLSLNSDQLTPVHHALSFSLVDYLVHLDPEKFNRLCKGLRARKPAREMLRSEYGLSPLTLESAWRAWVLDTYPTR